MLDEALRDNAAVGTRVSPSTLQALTCSIMLASGIDRAQAESVSRILVWADLVGRPNQGVERLEILLRRAREGLIRALCEPQFSDTGLGSCLLDGRGGFGHYVAETGMNRAIELASRAGIGVVGVHDSNFLGATGYYVNQAASSGMIGIALSNSFPKVTAHGGYKPVLGTNPMAFGAPRSDGRHLLIDMATSAAAGSSIRASIQQGKDLDDGVAVDRQGKPITDPAKVSNGALLPFGGAKGFALSMMVEILTGVITGAGFSHGVASMYNDFIRRGDNGHLFVAIDFNRWIQIDDYHERLENLLAQILDSGEAGSVRIPGAARWAAFEYNNNHGILLERETQLAISRLAEQSGILVPWKQSTTPLGHAPT